MIHINPQTQINLDSIKRQVPHALIISGQVGVGLSEIARTLGHQLRVILPEKNETVDLEKGIISVDIIRRLYDLTKTKTTTPRFIVIDYAERMATQAQNAFLKLLEEPPERTHFILLTHDVDSLLPTILSRSQRLDVRPITRPQSEALLDELNVKDQTKRQQLLFIADGLPAELTRLAGDDKAFEARAGIIRDARAYIQGTPYEVLMTAQKYKDNRETVLVLIEDAMKMLRSSLQNEADQRTLRRIDRLVTIYGRVKQNGNIRLQLGSYVV